MTHTIKFLHIPPKKLCTFFGAITLCILAPSSAGHASDLGPYKQPGLREDLRKTQFYARDLDNDDYLNEEEYFHGAHTLFDLIDQNRNGRIDDEEKAHYEESYKNDHRIMFTADEQETFDTRREKSLNTIDSDDDGKITRQEFLKYYKGRFIRMDNDRNGRISMQEYRTDVEKAATYNVDDTPNAE